MRAPQATDRSFSQVLLGVVAASVLLGSCAPSPGGSPEGADIAEVVADYDCLASYPGGWDLPPDPTPTPGPQHSAAPNAGRVPAGFTPTMAVRCDQSDNISDAEGQWTGVTAVTLDGDFSALLAALAEPDDGIGLGPCTADMELVSPLWLVDADGRAIQARYPRDSCGKTKPGVREALSGLAVRDTTALKRTLVVPRAALDSGCAATWAAPLEERTLLSVPSTGSLFGTDGVAPVAPEPIADTALTDVDGMRWCRYAAEPSPAGSTDSNGAAAPPGTITRRSGQFVAGGTLDTATAQLLAGVAASEPVPRSCDEPSTTFLALWPSRGGLELATVFTVELDGCQLLYRPGTGAHALPLDVLEKLAAQVSV